MQWFWLVSKFMLNRKFGASQSVTFHILTVDIVRKTQKPNHADKKGINLVFLGAYAL